MTGTVTTNPVADQLQLARTLVPGLARVGLLYNPAEPNASFEAGMAGTPQIWLNPLTARRLGLVLPATVLARAAVVQGPAAAATSCG